MRKFVFILFLALFMPVGLASAHSGRTDSSGGHYCRVGACAGTYHYHNGGYSAPTTNIERSPTTVTRVPVVTKKVVAEDAPINFGEIIDYDSKEYVGYLKVMSEGEKGRGRSSTEVTFTDGIETSRSTPSVTTLVSAKDRIIKKGTRIKPLAKINSVTKTSKKNKYDISGEYTPNSEVVLSVNSKKVKRSKTDVNGKFYFKNVKIRSDNVDLVIYSRVKRKENQISEKTTANLKNQTLKTEYAKLHS